MNDEHIKKYVEAIKEINFRINSIKFIYECHQVPLFIRVESAMLQIRKSNR
ncbi:MAG: hypothetical protein ACYCSW_09920 [bacterium]|jgi:UDP-N-acetylglucosamine 2-epimerase